MGWEVGEVLEERVLDALDVETVILVESDEEAKRVGVDLLKSLGFRDADVVFVERRGSIARIRLRVYIHRPGDRYGWLKGEER